MYRDFAMMVEKIVTGARMDDLPFVRPIKREGKGFLA